MHLAANAETTGETASLFLDLYPYRQREYRDPLEDWLTECLAVTIRALPTDLKAELFSHWIGVPASEMMACLSSQHLEVLTQYVTGNAGRPDMLVRLGGEPWILLENKVGHSVPRCEGEDGADTHQLRAYGDWLHEHGQDCELPLGMVFITHITPPPDDFRGQDELQLYHGIERVCTSWGALGRRLVELTSRLPHIHHAKAVTSAFMTYLKEQDMANEFPSSATFAAAEVYVAQAEPLENLVRRMWNELKIVANFGKTADRQLRAVTEEGSVSAWRFVAPGPASPSRDSILQTGVWFPETGLWFDPDDLGQELRGPQVYVFFGNTADDDLFSAVIDQPDGFLRPDGHFLACKAISEFPADPQARGEEIIQWVAQKAREMKTFFGGHGLIV